jgi:hypothetical protein
MAGSCFRTIAQTSISWSCSRVCLRGLAWRIHAFVLMGNHYHLQIETLKPDLSRAIQWLNLSFSCGMRE